MSSDIQFLTHLCDNWEMPVEAADVSRLDALLGESGRQPLNEANSEVAALACKAVADLCRQEANRQLFGSEATVAAVAALLRQSLEQSQWAVATQSLRACSNLCFEHNENRQRLGAQGVGSQLARAAKEERLVMACAAVVANLASENDEAMSWSLIL